MYILHDFLNHFSAAASHFEFYISSVSKILVICILIMMITEKRHVFISLLFVVKCVTKSCVNSILNSNLKWN